MKSHQTSENESISPSTTKRPRSKLLFFSLLFAGTILLCFLVNQSHNLYLQLINLSGLIEAPYQQWLERQNLNNNSLFLIPLAFLGGLFASISPCILSLLPVNLSYIGTLEITSRRDAFVKASSFTLGVTTIFTLFGLFTSFASAIMIDWRGYTNFVIGSVIVIMGLSVGGIIHLPVPQIQFSVPLKSPYSVGLTFALLTSPCGSPVLFTILMAAANSNSQIISVLAMISYALGYTIIIFVASLFTGLVKQSRLLLQQSQWIMSLGSVVMILTGGFYLYHGVIWFL